jgi:DNA polymerase III sliding clamp (beta) subunit (PCNA family)
MVTVQLTDALKPAVIIDRPYDGAMFTALLMPVRV